MSDTLQSPPLTTPDPARIAAAKPLEIPVTVQGSTAVAGEERRAIFTEKATTTLVFDNGTVLNLRVHLTPGQSVFLRNEQSGREVLCKVREAPAGGQSGCTDLEFASPDPEFWNPDAGMTRALSARQKIDAAIAKLGPAGEEVSNTEPAPGEAIATAAEPLNSPPEAAPVDAAAEVHAEQALAGDAAPEAARESAAAPDAVSVPPAMQQAEEPAAPSTQAPPQSEDSTLAMMGAASENVTIPKRPATIQEQLVAAHEIVPEAEHAATVTTAVNESSVPTGEEIDAALQKMGGAPIKGHPAPATQTKSDAQPSTAATEGEPQDPHAINATLAAKFAALLAGDARRAKYAAAEKEREALKAASEAGAEDEAELVPKITLEQRLTSGKGLWIVTISAVAVIIGCLFLIARAVYVPGSTELLPKTAVSRTQTNRKTLASFFNRSPKPATVHAAAPAKPGPAPVKSTAPNAATPQPQARTNSKPASAAPGAWKASQQPVTVASAPGAENSNPPASAPQISASPDSGANAQPVVTPSEDEPKVVESHGASSSESAPEPEPVKPAKAVERAALENTAAQIFSEVQPAFPAWAKDLGVEGAPVVKLDALIDEKGNLKATKVISGPRALQHAAQDAVTLWIFVPAVQNGKAVASHLTLTVEFQR